ncbi:DNA-binding transcriptional regulator, AcrR family [Lentibacillus persicus]|uniref:DNA-binding transcriptional regulator, AcrR family n=1 Tax=Lentibacillus persicus TaxID=640948 RepID=A0A1I1YWW2_9BACI|nr:TetR/AcrR family transcriptional regulator [Lentibacillus persicus]SFE24074.1 DNA-binding transcriptional regulator, AcrR family [Lentibacillus persicus]
MDKKMELFEAAQRIINSRGVSHLTLENIAKEAGMSKGGLLYHYPNKNALIEGGIKGVLENYAKEMENLNSQDTQNGHFLRSYAEVSLNNPQQLTSGLLAAISTNPELLQPIQDHYQNWQGKIEEDGLDPVLATIVRLTIDGLWFCDLFGLAPPEGELRKDLLERLFQLTQTEQE